MGCGYYSYEGREWRVPRLLWTLVYGPIPEGTYVLHTCDVPLCVNLCHLYLGTAKQNSRDMFKRGRQDISGLILGGKKKGVDHSGDKNPRAKLTQAQVDEIRISGENRRVLAARYGVSPGHVSKIRRGGHWK